MPSVSLIKTAKAPTLIFPPKVFEELKYIIDKQSEEVGWLFTVDRNEDGDFVVGEVFTPPQLVHPAETEIEAQAYLDWYNVLEAAEKDPANRLYGWGHSHVNMPVTPSNQDEMQFMEYGETCPFFIRTIHNKKGDIRVDIAFFDDNLLYSKCNWVVQYAILSDSHLKMLDDRMDMNVKKAPLAYSTYGRSSTGYTPPKVVSHTTTKGKDMSIVYSVVDDKKDDKEKVFGDYTQEELNAMPDKEYFALFNESGAGGYFGH